MKKWIYAFGGNLTEGSADMKDLLGGKGANLAEIASLGLPVPPGFTITTDVCKEYLINKKILKKEIIQQANEALESLSKYLNLKFGNSDKPLLLSVRSGSRISMPGMMDTILNVGLNDKTVKGLSNSTGNEWFAYDSYRRLVEMYGEIVLKIDRQEFEAIKSNYFQKFYLVNEQDLDIIHVKAIIDDYKALYKNYSKVFPQDPQEQLWNAILAVFDSWMNARAVKYRSINNIPEEWGTAVNIQSMVFGNFGDTSATGVCFTRNPSTGENKFYGEFLLNAQGEDVVAGTSTPAQITIEGKIANFIETPSLEELMPEVFKELYLSSKKLETHFKDMQDIEFTIQNKKLWLLQTRNGKRSALATVKLAVAMYHEGMISKNQAIMKVKPEDIDNLLHPTMNINSKEHKIICKGLPASPGAASGIICFNSLDAEMKYKGQKTILVRAETSPDDIGGMHSSEGIITAKGGMTSHAAVVARGMGKPCIVGASELIINESLKQIFIHDVILKEGDKISINGSTGDIILGEVKTIMPTLFPELEELLKWCDEVKTLGIRANADTQEDAKVSLKFGAKGIGLCRTEHMFFEPTRILSIRKMILAKDEDSRLKAIGELFLYQKKDFKDIFKVMKGLPVTIRLLDPPLHEFLPNSENDFINFAAQLKLKVNEVKTQVHFLSEVNPMLGHRGCRLAISHPEIYEMQIKAIFEAAQEENYDNTIEIMIPLIQNLAEFNYCKKLVDDLALKMNIDSKIHFNYVVGTMIELPRAALAAGELAKSAAFFSFGTNDLTQTTMGLSRDDSANFMHHYIDKKIFATDPFSTIDTDGVGEIMKIACKRGKKSNPNIKLGICGEHGGDPASIKFFHDLGLTYVSCSPYRIPIARLAAAQAKISKLK